MSAVLDIRGVDHVAAQAFPDERDGAVGRLMNPESVLIVGMSSKPGGVAHQVLLNLRANDFAGTIVLLGRSAGEIEGLPIVTDMADVPDGIDLAVLALPAAGVEEAIARCAERSVGAVVILASGFAELRAEGKAAQDRIGAVARTAGMPVLGPNCLGYINFRNGFRIGFVNVARMPVLAAGVADAVAIVAQSGGVQGHLFQSLTARGVDMSYSIATGNEMDLGVVELAAYLLEDEATRVLAIYSEQVADPEGLLRVARRARAVGKPIVFLHPGRSTKAQEAAKSHTGALAANHEVMRAKLAREGVAIVDTLDEMLDACELLARFPAPPRGGLGFVTFSGAFCSLAHDFCAELGIDVPALTEASVQAMRAALPAYITPSNPLDLGTQVLFQTDLMLHGMRALYADPNIGAIVVVIPLSTPANGQAFLQHIIEAGRGSTKPLGLVMLNDTNPLPDTFVALARANRIVLSRSADRVIRAMAVAMRRAAAPPPAAQPRLAGGNPPLALPSGTLSEAAGKALLAGTGIAVPPGGLARDADEAVAVAERIGFPVALKAQAAALAHKTEAGGVLLGIADAAAVRAGVATLRDNLRRHQPDLALEGVLVERMAPRGLELVVGATRDRSWGVTVLAGLGGVLVEALGDVRLIAPEAELEEIVAELRRLKTARLLDGFRGAPPVDVEAAARTVQAIGRLMLKHPEITEIDVNPLLVHPRGEGATAVDALIVCE